MGHKKTTFKHLSSYAHVVHTTAKLVISRRRKNENVDEKCMCKACKNTVFHCQICKFMGFLMLSSSWLLKLPITFTSTVKYVRMPSEKNHEKMTSNCYLCLCALVTRRFLFFSSTIQNQAKKENSGAQAPGSMLLVCAHNNCHEAIKRPTVA